MERLMGHDPRFKKMWIECSTRTSSGRPVRNDFSKFIVPVFRRVAAVEVAVAYGASAAATTAA